MQRPARVSVILGGEDAHLCAVVFGLAEPFQDHHNAEDGPVIDLEATVLDGGEPSAGL